MLVKLFIDWEAFLPYLKQIEKGRYLLVTTYRPSDRVELGPVGMGRYHIKWPLRVQKRKVGMGRYEVGMGRYGRYLLVTPFLFRYTMIGNEKFEPFTLWNDIELR